METISLIPKTLIHLSILFLSYLLNATSQNLSETQTTSSPSLSPQPPLTTFLDQRLAAVFPIIQTFKNTITSDPFNNTLSWVGPDICNYKGFYCDNPPDNKSAVALAAVDFNGFGLTAPTLDGFLDQLPDLAIFHANSNNFSGTISSGIAKLPYFYELDISNNKFFGSFPAAVLGISRLSFLDIRFNSFSGSVPPQVFNQNLDVLFLNNNNFAARIPENLGASPALYLTLANNNFTGPIPRSIFNTSSTLTEILLLNNKLTGCIPYELGFLKELVLFDASNNLLTGPLPCSLGCLAKIEQLNLAGNFLYGAVPEAVCGLGNLEKLLLSNNYFNKIGPQCGKLVKTGKLDVRKNCIPYLPNQRPWHECLGFFWHQPWHHCPYPATSFYFVPNCYHTNSPPPPPSQHVPRIGPKRNLVSYGALIRHRGL